MTIGQRIDAMIAWFIAQEAVVLRVASWIFRPKGNLDPMWGSQRYRRCRACRRIKDWVEWQRHDGKIGRYWAGSGFVVDSKGLLCDECRGAK